MGDEEEHRKTLFFFRMEMDFVKAAASSGLYTQRIGCYRSGKAQRVSPG
jgi:hypothetical protein